MRKLLLITGVPVPMHICRQQVHPVPVLSIIQNPKHHIVPDGENQVRQ